ncbi:hypothetical protein BDV18DRAFT_149490 [Aspergillus unguis]
MERQTAAKSRRSDSPRARSQQKYRLRKTLFKNANKYGAECDADVCVILRTRGDGRTFVFNTDSFEKFLPILQDLDRHYPPPVKKTPKDFTDEVANQNPASDTPPPHLESQAGD